MSERKLITIGLVFGQIQLMPCYHFSCFLNFSGKNVKMFVFCYFDDRPLNFFFLKKRNLMLCLVDLWVIFSSVCFLSSSTDMSRSASFKNLFLPLAEIFREWEAASVINCRFVWNCDFHASMSILSSIIGKWLAQKHQNGKIQIY